MEKLRIVLCGVGKMGNNYVRILSQAAECEIVAIVDSEPVKAKVISETLQCPYFRELPAALDSVKADAVIVVTPMQTHYALAKCVIERGLPLLIEKPLTDDVDTARRICELAEKAKAPVMVGHVERFNPAIVAARQLIAGGSIGKILNISTKRIGGTKADRADGRNIILDLAVHDLDLVYHFTGKEPVLRAWEGHYEKNFDQATLLLRAGETLVDIHVSWLGNVKTRQIQISGTEGFLFLNLISQSVSLVRENPVLSSTQSSGDLSQETYLRAFSRPDEVQVGIYQQEALREEIKSFLELARNPQAKNAVGARDGFRAMKLADQATKNLLESLGTPTMIKAAA